MQPQCACLREAEDNHACIIELFIILCPLLFAYARRYMGDGQKPMCKNLVRSIFMCSGAARAKCREWAPEGLAKLAAMMIKDADLAL